MKYVVTIARTYGSGGKEIGKLLAKDLGIKYYGREIFEMSQGVESDLDSGDDESIHNASLEEADELFKQQSKTIREIAEKESCVIVGRCADMCFGIWIMSLRFIFTHQSEIVCVV